MQQYPFSSKLPYGRPSEWNVAIRIAYGSVFTIYCPCLDRPVKCLLELNITEEVMERWEWSKIIPMFTYTADLQDVVLVARRPLGHVLSVV